jgi:hypothetical protein
MRNKLFVTPPFYTATAEIIHLSLKKKLGILPAYGSPSGGNIRYPSLKKILASAEDL